MSPRTTESRSTDEDENGMETGQDPRRGHTSTRPGESNGNLATLLRDSTNWLSNIPSLRDTDVIVLLTPVVIPISQDPADTSDPFEPLGRSLAKRHSKIRHIPYTQKNGITSTHIGFIKRGHVIILCFAPATGQDIQLNFADVAFAVSDNKPYIIVVCCSPLEGQQAIPFPTVIQTKGYSPAALEATAALIFSEPTLSTSRTNTTPAPTRTESTRPRPWPIEPLDEARDISSVLNLWNQNISSRFSIDLETLSSLLDRPGYAKHYVVREPRSREIIGFCATYLSFVDQKGDDLIGSLALLLVRSTERKQGVGLSLHRHAITEMRQTRGVMRLQLGSTFPRLLHGPPLDMQLNEEWFRRRGWELNRDLPGRGQILHDLILDFADWRYEDPGRSSSTEFRLCSQGDMDKVVEMVDKQSSAKQNEMGWFDQYSSLMNESNIKDIVLGIENGVIIAAAITYTPFCGSKVASNLPWASRIGNDVGGVTCICISPPQETPTIMGLLNTCVENLRAQGMRRMFLDGVTNDAEHFGRIGFAVWARYRDVWRDA